MFSRSYCVLAILIAARRDSYFSLHSNNNSLYVKWKVSLRTKAAKERDDGDFPRQTSTSSGVR